MEAIKPYQDEDEEKVRTLLRMMVNDLTKHNLRLYDFDITKQREVHEVSDGLQVELRPDDTMRVKVEMEYEVNI